MLRRVLVLLGLLWFTQSVWAGLSHDSRLDWYTLKSKHFNIHFHNNEEKLARRVLPIAERVHNKLSNMILWSPESRTDIILTDEYDVSNGYATPFPTNRFAIFLSPPDSVNGIEDNASWMETVITHEYMHILHLDKATGAAGVFRKFFGRIFYLFPIFTAFPNGAQPNWLIEGLATWAETDKARGVGRGQSTFIDMYMRMEVEGGFKTLRHINQPIVDWPMGSSWYLYGVHFFQFIEEKYGRDKIFELIDGYSDNIIPFRLNSNARNVFGKDMWALWDEFHKYMQEKYRPQVAEVNKRGAIEGTRLTYEGYFTGPLQVMSDGRIFYSDYNADRNSALMRLTPDKEGKYGKPYYLRELKSDIRFDVHPKAGIAMARLDVCRNAELFYDLYLVDPDDGDATRITNCSRYRMVTWGPDGKQLIAVKNSLGVNELHLLDLKGKVKEVLWKGKLDEVISFLDWSPSENIIIASVFRPKTGWNLEKFDIDKKQWSFITKDDAIETSPMFTRDGKYLLYSADNGGIYNIQRMDMATGKTEKLTDVVGGAFFPAQGKNEDDLIYIGYSHEGFDVYHLKVTQTREVPKADDKPTAIALPEPEPVATSPVEPYSAGPSFWPRWYAPILFSDNDEFGMGAYTAAWDTLQRHILGVSALYYNFDSKYDTVLGSLDYSYDRLYPIFKLHASRTADIFLDTNDDPTRVRQEDTKQAEVVLPFLSVGTRLSFHLAAIQEKKRDVWRRSDIATRRPTVDNLLGVAMVYKDATFHPRSISRAEGRVIQLVAENSDSFGNSDYTGSVYTLDWREYIRLGGQHVLALRAVEGRGTDSPRPFKLGGNTSNNFEPPLLSVNNTLNSPFNRRDYMLRGYSDGHAELSGRRMRLTSVEYRFPIYRFERGTMIPPVGIHQLSGSVFIDRGAAWDTGSPSKYYTGVGTEMYADVVLGYNFLIRVTFGYAHGTDSQLGKDEFYLRLGSSF